MTPEEDSKGASDKGTYGTCPISDHYQCEKINSISLYFPDKFCIVTLKP